jgi:hypothetical protein
VKGSHVVPFAVYAIAGFIELWLLLLAWGFSRGPVDALPYLALIGCLALVLLAAPMALFTPRIAAALALPSALLAFAWPVRAVQDGSIGGALLIGGLPMAAVVVAVRELRVSLARRGVSQRSGSHLLMRVGLALLPILGFGLMFNVRLVLALVLAGPPR